MNLAVFDIVELETAGHSLDGIEAEVRPEIEQKYADEWNASGLLKRWFLSRKIEKEIVLLVTEKSKHIPPDALF